jgi:hypothetical protein
MKYVLVVLAVTAVMFGVGYEICELDGGRCEPVTHKDFASNPSFEEATQDEQIPDNWFATGLSGNEGRDCTTAHTGSCSFQMSARGANKVKTLSQLIDDQGAANESVFMAVFVKSEGKAQDFPTYSATFYHADGTSEVFTFAAEGGFHNWLEYTGEYSVLQDYVSAKITLTFGGAEHIWFDDVRFIATAGAPPLPPEVTISP